jgi:nicotinate (nicotinamide) nucleotide adenylyltransferase
MNQNITFNIMTSKKTKKIVIVGGAFDPPTNAHLQLFAQIIHSKQYDEVWIVPSGQRSDKSNMTDPISRLIMINLAINTYYTPDFPIKVIDTEIKIGKQIPTYDLLCMFRDKYNNIDFTFCVGSDWLQPNTDLRSWESNDPNDKTGKKMIVTGHKLIQEFDFLIIARPGYEVKNIDSFGKRFKLLKLPKYMQIIYTNGSSSEIRRRIKGNRSEKKEDYSSIQGLIPVSVYAYIKRNAIY